MYVLLYDEGAPILVMSSMENGVSCLHVRYFPTAQLENCQNTTDLMFYFTGNNVPFEVTEILPQGDLADMAEAAQYAKKRRARIGRILKVTAPKECRGRTESPTPQSRISITKHRRTGKQITVRRRVLLRGKNRCRKFLVLLFFRLWGE